MRLPFLRPWATVRGRRGAGRAVIATRETVARLPRAFEPGPGRDSCGPDSSRAQRPLKRKV
ncbi:hypothetical protein C882_2531 [Caenispirillum salinarum AK4]|uniref:Uncharacterized protein n=1 Tax=Caenispirillum salinarum AK4 TaxID=1238182 RepID=K9H4F4_9PROT|nr:hypothetical protein C882_2531 [Caenispirillum salinarum AK4]